MKKLWFACAVALCFACGQVGSVDQLRAGIPSADNVKLSAPAQSGASAEVAADVEVGHTAQALQGDTSGMYELTAGATALVNGGTLAVLNVLHDVVSTVPTSHTAISAVWGPYTAPLSPNSWKLTVTKTGDHTYSYSAEAKPKDADDSAYVVVLTGTHTPALGANGQQLAAFGSGSFVADWDALRTLPNHRNDLLTGQGTFTYARPSSTDAASIDVVFKGLFNQNDGVGYDAAYHWQQTPGGQGAFSFTTEVNLDGDSADTLENVAIESRWMNDGEGRSDAEATNGSLTAPATLSECWDESFASIYLDESFASQNDYGSESDCAFTSADFPSQNP